MNQEQFLAEMMRGFAREFAKTLSGVTLFGPGKLLSE